jgi:hypothetical protein
MKTPKGPVMYLYLIKAYRKENLANLDDWRDILGENKPCKTSSSSRYL